MKAERFNREQHENTTIDKLKMSSTPESFRIPESSS